MPLPIIEPASLATVNIIENILLHIVKVKN